MTDDLIEDQAHAIPPGFTQMNWVRGFGRQIGPIYERRDGGESYIRAFYVAEHHANGMNNCHGGMLMAFADTAFGHAVSMRYPNRFWVTVRLLTDFVSAARMGDWVEGTGEIVGEDDGLITVRGRIWVADRTVMAGTGIFKVGAPRGG